MPRIRSSHLQSYRNIAHERSISGMKKGTVLTVGVVHGAFGLENHKLSRNKINEGH